MGCGIGGLFDVIGRHRVAGIDGVLNGLFRTRARYPDVPLVAADAARLPFHTSSLKALTAQHLLEHIAQFRETCAEWYRVLEPGGVLVVATPNAHFIDPAVFDDPSHVQIFTPDLLRDVVRAAGFSVEDMRSLGLPWFKTKDAWKGSWRARRFVVQHAKLLSRVPGWKWQGQTLCCIARRS